MLRKVFAFFFVLAIGVATFILFTREGTLIFTRFIIEKSPVQQRLRIGEARGSLGSVLTLRGVYLKDIPGMRPGATAHASQLSVSLFLKLTDSGRNLVVRYLRLGFSGGTAQMRKVSTGLDGNFTIYDLKLRHLDDLPPGSEIKVQRIDGKWPLTLDNIRSLQNGRFMLPHSDPALFYVDADSRLQIYSKKIDIADLLYPFWDNNLKLRNVSGVLEDVSLSVSGSPDSFEVKGEGFLRKLVYRQFSAKDVPVSLALSLQRLGKEEWNISGDIRLKGGSLYLKETEVRLAPSRIFFQGDPRVPSFDLNGQATVEDTDMEIILRGTALRPELKLAGAGLPQDQLLIMLATGQKWEGSEQALKEGRISADLAKEFIDYFIFGGSGKRLSETLGIKSIRLEYNEEVRGVGVKKDLFRNVDAIYSVEQPQQTREKVSVPPTLHKIGAELRLDKSSSLAVEGKSELKPRDAQKAGEIEEGENDAAGESVTVEYKRKF